MQFGRRDVSPARPRRALHHLGHQEPFICLESQRDDLGAQHLTYRLQLVPERTADRVGGHVQVAAQVLGDEPPRDLCPRRVGKEFVQDKLHMLAA
eukprot:2436345-Prymnesium_polylepis.2